MMRPANIITAVADVLAGIAISKYFTGSLSVDNSIGQLFLLCLATTGLYGGGVVFNDVFDAALDRIERPERPIPSGLITVRQAVQLGAILLLIGIISAFFCNSVSGLLAVCIAAAALIYDKWGKHYSVAGPLNMGLCRGLNLLLGISIVPGAVEPYRILALVPVIYIASITMISRGEVHGGSKKTLYFALFLYVSVIALISGVAYVNGNMLDTTVFFLLPFAWMIFRPLLKAIDLPIGANIGKAVKAGVIGLIMMDASWAAAFGSPYLAIPILLLLPLSLYLSRLFAVT